MEPKPDIEALLDDKGEENDLEEPIEEPQPDKSAGDDDKPLTPEQAKELKEKNRKLLDQLKARQAREKLLKQQLEEAKSKPTKKEGEEPPPEIKNMTPEQLREAAKTNPDAKAWLDLINEEIDRHTKPMQEATYRNALRAFVGAHPEYAATAEGRAKFKALEVVAKRNGLDTAADESAKLDILNRAHAFQNLDERKDDGSKQRARHFAAQHAAPGAGRPAEDAEFSQEEVEGAAKHGMTPERYRAAQSVYGPGNNINT
jgi:hypothetical protein